MRRIRCGGFRQPAHIEETRRSQNQRQQYVQAARCVEEKDPARKPRRLWELIALVLQNPVSRRARGAWLSVEPRLLDRLKDRAQNGCKFFARNVALAELDSHAEAFVVRFKIENKRLRTR